MDQETKLFWASLDFLTLERRQVLQKYFGNLNSARTHFSEAELLQAKIPRRSVTAVIKKHRELNFAKVQKDFEKSSAELLFYGDENFPEALKNIPDPPMFLFVKGDIAPGDHISLAVVGTRRCSTHGKQAVSYFLPDVISAGFTIVSGMARGIDAEAHHEALRQGGRTIAIWGTGIDVIYPQQNSRLAQEIEKNGVIISEFPLGTEPNNYNFPRRNRLISGCSLGTLVIEGKEKSGSLITAHLALEQGKEVFAVPSSPFSASSEATNRLIQRGEAKLVQTAADILQEFSFVQKTAHPKRFIPENELERKVFATMTKEPMHFDEIIAQTKIPAYELSPILTMLAMKAIVKDLGMNQWARNF